VLDAKTYGLGSILTIPGNVRVVGQPGMSKLKAIASLARMVDCPNSNVSIEGMTFDAAGLVTSEIIRSTSAATNFRLHKVTFTDTGQTVPRAVNFQSSDSLVDDCDFDGCATAVQVINQPSRITISNNRIKNWSQRGIFVQGSTTVAGCAYVNIIGNRITDLVNGGTSRYPIRVEGVSDSFRHQYVTISENYVQGRNTAYTDPTSPGTADQISVVRTNGLKITNNWSLDGGDGGICVSTQCSDVVISGNVIKRANSTGLWLGANSIVFVRDATVTGNTIVNNGQNRQGDINRPSGIVAQNAFNSLIAGNTIGNNGTTVQKTGVYVVSCDNITLGPNTDAGNALEMYNISADSTNIRDINGQITRTSHMPALGMYFPEAEGAAGNGTTDDATAIQAALDAAGAAGNGARVIFAPGKTYALGSQITVPANVRIEGRATLRMLASATSRAILVQNVSNVQIADLTIDLNKTATTNGGSTTNQQGIYVSVTNMDISSISIRDVKVINGWQRGIAAAASSGHAMTDLTIENCTVSEVGGVGIFVSANGNTDKVTASMSRRINVRGCTMTGSTGSGIQLYGVSSVDVSNNFLEGSASTGHGIVFSTSGSGVQVTDFTCTDNKISGYTTTSSWGIVVSNSCTRFTLTGNQIDSCAGGITIDVEDGSAPGVLVNAAAAVSANTVSRSQSSHGINARVCSNLSISGNSSNNNALAGIAVTNAYGVIVSGNTCNGNSKYGIAIYGTDSGTGGHMIGPNVVRDNTSGELGNSNPPIACSFVTVS
jgi:parallel beta-helix repeat protein